MGTIRLLQRMLRTISVSWEWALCLGSGVNSHRGGRRRCKGLLLSRALLSTAIELGIPAAVLSVYPEPFTGGGLFRCVPGTTSEEAPKELQL